MTLACRYFDTLLELTPNKLNSLIIENPRFFTECVRDLISPGMNDPGCFVLSDGYDDNKLLEKTLVIIDFFQFHNNDKRILSAINKYLVKELIESRNILNDIVVRGGEIIRDAARNIDAAIEIDEDIDIASFIKLYKPHVSMEPDSFLANILQYINLMIEFCDIKLMIFVNIKDYLEPNEFAELLKHCCYAEIPILCIASHESYKVDNENIVIIDKDLCEI